MSAANVVQLSISFVPITCANCGCGFAITKHMHSRRNEDGKDFYCPNGHPNVYRETEVDRLKKQIESEKREREYAENRAKREGERADRYQRSANAYKGQVTKVRKRVGNGVCPCCNRTFQNLMRHMETKHPQYKHIPHVEAGSADRFAKGGSA